MQLLTAHKPEGEIEDEPTTRQVITSPNEYREFLEFKKRDKQRDVHVGAVPNLPKRTQNVKDLNLHQASPKDSILVMTRDEKCKHNEFIKIKEECHKRMTLNKNKNNPNGNAIDRLKRLISLLESNDARLANEYSSMMNDFEKTEFLCSKQWKLKINSTNKDTNSNNVNEIDCVELMQKQINSFNQLNNLVSNYQNNLEESLSSLMDQSVKFSTNLSDINRNNNNNNKNKNDKNKGETRQKQVE